MLDYISDVLSNIKFLCSIFATFIGVQLFFAYFNDVEFFFKVNKNMKKYFIIFCILIGICIFIPSNLKYSVASKYIKENGELERKVIKMEKLIDAYNLEQQLKEVENEDY